MREIERNYDIVVVGGGMAGLCAAVAAAREGSDVALVHNRPVLGGNASSEIRMHIVGADYHGTRPNARETGILEEILLEHKHRNPENSWAIFDSILWEKATFQENLSLYLNTHISEVVMSDRQIAAVCGIQQNTETRFRFYAKVFVDATGDAMLAALAGADTVIGREGKDIYNEPHAPEISDHYTMGSSLMLKARDIGHPVPFIRPFWANTYSEEDMKNRAHEEISSGYWWIELGGGEQHVIEDGEVIRDELLKTIFGVWDHIKNGGRHGAENYELEWVGFLPGKRESRRVLGDYVLREQDCQNAARFEDTVAYGGWPMDVHVIEGFRNRNEEANEFLCLDDVYAIPYRCFYSRNVENLMLAGRDISCSHMAFASTRVMGTCAIGGQAVGVAASMALKRNVLPREIGADIKTLQQKLLRQDCYLPGIAKADPLDVATSADVTASSYQRGAEPQNILNGCSRTVGTEKNYWQPDLEATPWIQLKLSQPRCLREVQFLFDSNLSREIMISLSETHLTEQEKSTPSTLVKDFTIEFILNGKIVDTMTIHDNYQRRVLVTRKVPIQCDTLKVIIQQTYGTCTPKVFEIRLYE
jgi:FAD dependent oxidoreductase